MILACIKLIVIYIAMFVFSLTVGCCPLASGLATTVKVLLIELKVKD